MLWFAFTIAAAIMPEVVWRAPPGCPTEAAVRDRVATLLAGAEVTAGAAVELTVETRADGRWRLHAVLHGPSGVGERTLDADTCDALAETAALLTAIAAQPSLAGTVPPPPPPSTDSSAAEERPPQPSGEQASPVVVPPTETAPSRPAPPTARPRARRGLLALGGGVAVGVLTTPMAVLRAAGGVRGRRWSVALTQTFWLPRDMPSAEVSGVGGRMWLWAAGLRGCGIPVNGRVEVDLCGAVEVGGGDGSWDRCVDAERAADVCLAGVERRARLGGPGWDANPPHSRRRPAGRGRAPALLRARRRRSLLWCADRGSGAPGG
jgi:hypothetical protein